MGKDTKNYTTQITSHINKFFKEQNLSIDKDVLDEDIIKKTIINLIIEKNISLRELSKILKKLPTIINSFKHKKYNENNSLICVVLTIIKITKKDIYEKLLNDSKKSEELDSQTTNEIENIFEDQKILECIPRSYQHSIATLDDESNCQNSEQEIDREKNSMYHSIKDACELIEKYYPKT